MPQFLDFSVSLRGLLPRPWRRFRLRAAATFEELHQAIADAAGWSGAHLWVFTVEHFEQELAIAPTPDGEPLAWGDLVMLTAARTRLTRYLGVAPGLVTTCRYVYDFGDEWQVDVLLHDRLTLGGRARRTVMDGEHAWPPEDCGGPPMFGQLREAIRTGSDQELLDWARDAGWSDAFDLEELQRSFNR